MAKYNRGITPAKATAWIGVAMLLLSGYYNIRTMQDREKALRERNEIFFSNYQDEVNCKLDSLKIKNCK